MQEKNQPQQKKYLCLRDGWVLNSLNGSMMWDYDRVRPVAKDGTASV